MRILNKFFECAILTRVFLSFALFVGIPSCFESKKHDINEITSFNEVNFDAIKPNTLVIFDVDETLVQPLDAYLINEQSEKAQLFRQKIVIKYPTIKNWDYLTSLVLQETERPLIEPEVIKKINNLKKRNIPVIACTSMNTGPYGALPLMEKWRYEHLKSLGFEGSYADLLLTWNLFERKPVFYKGILATDLEQKGPVIGAFLDSKHLYPLRIIMFDDVLDFLISVQKECKKRNIQFQGYLYRGAQEKPWHEDLFEFQVEYLIKYKKWLSDKEAQNISFSNHAFVEEVR